MVYRILLVVPFSATSLRPTPAGAPGAPRLVLVTSLLFDAIVWPNNTLRPICTLWVNWSYKRIMKLANILNRLRPQAVASRAPRHGHGSSRRSSGTRTGSARGRSQSPRPRSHPHKYQQTGRAISIRPLWPPCRFCATWPPTHTTPPRQLAALAPPSRSSDVSNPRPKPAGSFGYPCCTDEMHSHFCIRL